MRSTIRKSYNFPTDTHVLIIKKTLLLIQEHDPSVYYNFEYPLIWFSWWIINNVIFPKDLFQKSILKPTTNHIKGSKARPYLVNSFIRLVQKIKRNIQTYHNLHHQYYLQSNKRVYPAKNYKVCWFYCSASFLRHVITMLIDFPAL